MKKILLDTNAYTALLAGDKAVFTVVAGAKTVFMSIFVLGELYAGFRGGTRERDNMHLLQRFLDKPTCEVVRAGRETARIFGELKNDLRRNGTPLPINDVWIGAHAIETASVLISYDNHFSHITGLRRWSA